MMSGARKDNNTGFAMPNMPCLKSHRPGGDCNANIIAVTACHLTANL